MRNYGGLRKKIPYTFWAMMIGTLAITGVGVPLTHFGFAGFLSKDAVIESAWAGTNAGFPFWILVVAALLTSFYSWRLMLMTFFGEPKEDSQAYSHAKESPMVMLIPLGILGIGAILSGMIWYSSFFGKDYQVAKFFGMESEYHQKSSEGSDDNANKINIVGIEEKIPPAGAIFMGPENHVLHDAHYAPIWVKISPFLAMLAGLFMALWFYVWDKKKPAQWASTLDPVYRLLLNKWYFDEIYEAIFVSRAKAIGRFFWKKGDVGIIDGIINGIAMGIIPFVTRVSTRLQSGYIFSYALGMVLGIVALLSWMIFSVGIN